MFRVRLTTLYGGIVRHFGTFDEAVDAFAALVKGERWVHADSVKVELLERNVNTGRWTQSCKYTF